jgi:hypothetical protein
MNFLMSNSVRVLFFQWYNVEMGNSYSFLGRFFNLKCKFKRTDFIFHLSVIGRYLPWATELKFRELSTKKLVNFLKIEPLQLGRLRHTPQ